MKTAFLTTGAETRLRAQQEILRNLTKDYEEEKRAIKTVPFVTLSRQYGCMAYELAESLANRLNMEKPEWHFTVYDRDITTQLAEQEMIETDVINRLSERKRGAIEDWADSMIGGKPPEIQVFYRLARMLCSIASLGHAILIGRGGSAITRKIPGGIHIRLIAPVDWRIENLKKDPERASEANRAFIKQADLERENFVRKYLGIDANDPELYHLIINTQKLTMDDQVDMIVRLALKTYEAQ